MSTVILALDTALVTGWALRLPGGGLESGVQELRPHRGESHGMTFLRFRSWLRTMLDDHKPEVVYYERAHHRGGAATNLCVGLTSRIEEECAERRIEYGSVPTMTLKKHATGKGNSDKAAMVAAATAVLGRAPLDDNEADAVLVLRYAEAEVGR